MIQHTEIATDLVRTEMIQFDFNGKGKWKFKIHDIFSEAPLSPFYTNLRDLRSFPGLHDRVVDAYAHEIARSQIENDIKLDYISDVPLAITPTTGIISVRTHIPMITPRFDAKTHGLEQGINGRWTPGEYVGVIDDIRTTGGSKELVARHLEAHGLVVSAFYVLIDYDPWHSLIMGKPVFAVFGWDDLLVYYRDHGEISSSVYYAAFTYHDRLSAYMAAQRAL